MYIIPPAMDNNQTNGAVATDEEMATMPPPLPSYLPKGFSSSSKGTWPNAKMAPKKDRYDLMKMA